MVQGKVAEGTTACRFFCRGLFVWFNCWQPLSWPFLEQPLEATVLICPICESALQETSTGVTCENRHAFDRARQGYLNLLPVQYKASRAPGDNAAMVEARRKFLSAGHYQPVAGFLCDHAASSSPASWLDIGCGEGYYTDQLAQQLAGTDGYALDISKQAIIQSCRRNKSINWLVAGMARIPLASQSMDLLLSVFSPLDWQEAERLLSASGTLLHLGPASDHLIELRRMVYDEVRPYDDGKHLGSLPAGLRVVQTEYLTFALELCAGEDRRNLLAMTPHGQRTGEERYDKVVRELETVTVSVRLDRIVRAGG